MLYVYALLIDEVGLTKWDKMTVCKVNTSESPPSALPLSWSPQSISVVLQSRMSDIGRL